MMTTSGQKAEAPYFPPGQTLSIFTDQSKSICYFSWLEGEREGRRTPHQVAAQTSIRETDEKLVKFSGDRQKAQKSKRVHAAKAKPPLLGSTLSSALEPYRKTCPSFQVKMHLSAQSSRASDPKFLGKRSSL